MKWRLLDTGAADAAMNMAIDEALMRSCTRDSEPFLRFYTWDPPAVSIGRHQELDREVDREACARLGIDVVRRPTGGRTVLHEHELTYSIVISQAMLPGSIVATYRRLSEGLVRGIRRLGIQAELHSPRGKQEQGLAGACFDSPSWYELTVEGRKVVGSAQVRTGGVILQHGSIVLDFDPDRLLSVLPMGQETRSRNRLAAVYARVAGGLSEFTPVRPGTSDVATAIAAGVVEALDVELVPGRLSREELRLAERLRAEKYRDESWNGKRIDRTSSVSREGS